MSKSNQFQRILVMGYPRARLLLSEAASTRSSQCPDGLRQKTGGDWDTKHVTTGRSPVDAACAYEATRFKCKSRSLDWISSSHWLGNDVDKRNYMLRLNR